MIKPEAEGFAYFSGDEKIGEIHFKHQAGYLFAYHTYVDPKARGQRVAEQLLDALVDYARQHQQKIVAQCSYVQSVFERKHDKYQDVIADN